MSTRCPESEATLAWLYGEGDEAHLTHVGSCPECQALVEEHESVLSAVGPVMAQVAKPEPRPEALPVAPARRASAWLAPVLTLAAAAVLAALWWGNAAPVAAPEAPIAASPVPVAALEVIDDPLDDGLDDLDAEIDDLFADLEAL